MKTIANLMLSLLLAGLFSRLNAQDPVDLIEPMMGTASEMALSHGNTYPAIGVPWGMHTWSPQTGKAGDGWLYSYGSHQFQGIRLTHQPSPWINDYGSLCFMPMTGTLRPSEDTRPSWFSHLAEKARPYHYEVFLGNDHIRAEVTPTERAAQLRFTFSPADTAWVLVDGFPGESAMQYDAATRTLTGYSTYNNGGVPANFKLYFVAVFSEAAVESKIWEYEKSPETRTQLQGKRVQAALRFRKPQQLRVQFAASFISEAQARLNLTSELGTDDFETTLGRARAAWQAALGRINIEGGTETQRRTFYSCLYRVLLFPRAFFETDAKGEVVHYSPYNGEVRPGYLYTDNGFWDTFRAVFPLFSLVYPDLEARIMEGLVHTYEESGWLPEWASPGHRDCMIGSNSSSLIAEAWLKGVRGFDVEKLYEAMKKSSGGVGPVNSVGRLGAEWYNDLGYVPCDVGIRENAARTLEYAYADYAIWQLAKALKKPQAEIDLYAARARNYRNLFDPATRLMRGKTEKGSFRKDFNPFAWGGDFTEGNSWHYSWSVFHDMQGLISLMGGPEATEAMLDSVFRMPSNVYDYSYYGFVIHEIREMNLANMGQYAHGNQPIQHMPYLYAFTGSPWKTQHWVRQIMNRLYHPRPDGYCGDEDNGQTSAWYVFSAMGFYPVNPASGQYVQGVPLFDRVTLHLPNGKTLHIEAKGNTPEAAYVHATSWNGVPYSRLYFNHADLIQGGVLSFDLSPLPAKNRTFSPHDFPYSMTPR